MRRLEKLDRGVMNRTKGVDPTVDAEAVKYVMVEMLVEAGVHMFLHCWGVDAIMDGLTVKGAVFESKSGRQAILAEQTVDKVGKVLGRRLPECRTRAMKLPGAYRVAEARGELEASGLLSEDGVERLLGVYGGRAIDVPSRYCPS